MNDVHLKLVASQLQNKIKPKGKRLDENDIGIMWLAYTIFASDNLSKPGRTRGEGRIVAIVFF